jgi:hypothetical protein
VLPGVVGVVRHDEDDAGVGREVTPELAVGMREPKDPALVEGDVTIEALGTKPLISSLCGPV